MPLVLKLSWVTITSSIIVLSTIRKPILQYLPLTGPRNGHWQVNNTLNSKSINDLWNYSRSFLYKHRIKVTHINCTPVSCSGDKSVAYKDSLDWSLLQEMSAREETVSWLNISIQSEQSGCLIRRAKLLMILSICKSNITLDKYKRTLLTL